MINNTIDIINPSNVISPNIYITGASIPEINGTYAIIFINVDP